MVKRYRKKVVEIEAIVFEYSSTGIAAMKEFCGDVFVSHGKDRHPAAIGWATIGTLEDGGTNCAPQVRHLATEGDYIIKGVEGEFYACKPNIFAKTYEEV